MSILVASWTLKSLVGCIIWGASSGAGSVITSFWKERICSLAFSASLARDKRSAALGHSVQEGKRLSTVPKRTWAQHEKGV